MNLGIDIHDHYAQVAVVNDDGNLLDEIRLPTDRLDELAEEYAGGKAAIEASGNYRAVYEVLVAPRSTHSVTRESSSWAICGDSETPNF